MSRDHGTASESEQAAIDAILDDPRRGVNNFSQGHLRHTRAILSAAIGVSIADMYAVGKIDRRTHQQALKALHEMRSGTTTTDITLQDGRIVAITSLHYLPHKKIAVSAPFQPHDKEEALRGPFEVIRQTHDFGFELSFDTLTRGAKNTAAMITNPTDAPIVAPRREAVEETCCSQKGVLMRDLIRPSKHAPLRFNGHFFSVMRCLIGANPPATGTKGLALRTLLFDASVTSGIAGFLTEVRRQLTTTEPYHGIHITDADRTSLRAALLAGAEKAIEFEELVIAVQTPDETDTLLAYLEAVHEAGLVKNVKALRILTEPAPGGGAAAEEEEGGAAAPEAKGNEFDPTTVFLPTILHDPTSGINNFKQVYFALVRDLCRQCVSETFSQDQGNPEANDSYHTALHKAFKEMICRTELTVAGGMITGITAHFEGISTPLTLPSAGDEGTEASVTALSELIAAKALEMKARYPEATLPDLLTAEQVKPLVRAKLASFDFAPTADKTAVERYHDLVKDFPRSGLSEGRTQWMINGHDCTLITIILAHHFQLEFSDTPRIAHSPQIGLAISAELFQAALTGGMPAFSARMQALLGNHAIPSTYKVNLRLAIHGATTSDARSDHRPHDIPEAETLLLRMNQAQAQIAAPTFADCVTKKQAEADQREYLQKMQTLHRKQVTENDRWIALTAVPVTVGIVLAIAAPLALAAMSLLTPPGIAIAMIAILIVSAVPAAFLGRKAHLTDPRVRRQKALRSAATKSDDNAEKPEP